MRTRFLDTDYFTISQSPLETSGVATRHRSPPCLASCTVSVALRRREFSWLLPPCATPLLETLSFINLQPPRLPPSNPSSFNDDLLHFDPLLYDVPLQVERLPIDAALSKFLSEATPQFIDVDFGFFKDTQPPSATPLLETLSFLNLQPPRLPPSNPSSFNDDLLHFDPLLYDVPLQVERLPIDAALSKFLSEATPQFIDVDFGFFKDTQPPSGNVGANLSEIEL
ncbi:hypothetical protein COLO4_31594 [Corchorus olitorius]|uniref:Uncharacterized protein n=1 Tax=Corchorus olitorius TaxID=93759 RepID=A0A1R3H471_9ROSI|nr:hypothetical protein COLO4_31594 [Corchorus olitorius]